MDPYRSTVATQPASFTASGALSINKVLRNTYLLLSATLLFSAAMAGLAMLVGLPAFCPKLRQLTLPSPSRSLFAHSQPKSWSNPPTALAPCQL